jgi:transcriptional regulator GlxA family with amidase domain
VQDRLLDDISVEDIAGAAGVSVRALYDGFTRHCGAPPMAYLRALRLDRARQALIRRAAGGARVTDIALEHGFTHLGKFARAYARRFGERPSETIARSR